MQTLLNFLVKLVVLSVGLAVGAMLMVVFTFFAAFWGMAYLWARLTGRPVAPFVMRAGRRGGFGRMHRQPADAAPGRGARSDLAEVTDVEAKPPRT